jgi:hypothetical protein
VKSGERIADEMEQIGKEYRLTNFFGTDDNFFNDTKRTLEIAETLARKAASGKRPFTSLRYFTEATVHDTIRIQEHLPLIRQSGLRAVWMGVEDLTGTLVKKGQNESKTLEAFRLLRENGIYPIPMMMHHDSQPLVSWKSNYGIINQLRTLRKAGAIYTQVLMLSPAPGSKWYEETFTSGLAFDSVDGNKVEQWISDGNYVVASKHRRPWLKQLNLLLAYTYFFNPLRLLLSLIWSKSNIPLADAEPRPPSEVAGYPLWKRFARWANLKARAQFVDAAAQLFGMAGLFHTYRRTLVWAWRLYRGQIKRCDKPPASLIPMRNPAGGPASHALPGTPLPELTNREYLLPMVPESTCKSAAKRAA